jgi:hypothetical protein
MENKPQSLEDRIKQLAYEKYLYREENQMFITIDNEGKEIPITEKDDYLQAEDEIIREERPKWQ